MSSAITNIMIFGIRLVNQKEFLIAGGYKFNIIKKFFEKKKIKDLKVEVVDTGNKSMTGGRIYKLKKF